MTQSGRHRATARHAKRRNLTLHYLSAGVGAIAIASLMVAVHPLRANASVGYVDVPALVAADNNAPSIRDVGHGVQEISVQAAVAFDNEVIEDPNIAKGTEFIDRPGVPGVEHVTYTVVTVAGKEVSRTLVRRELIKQPRNARVIRGTGDPNQTGIELKTAARGVGKPDGNKAFAQVFINQQYGWGDDQFGCLVKLWKRESNWRVNARNRHSGAYGIPQALPGRKMGTIASDWRTNAVTQIKWGAGYIKGRYGTPCGAWDHSQRRGWY